MLVTIVNYYSCINFSDSHKIIPNFKYSQMFFETRLPAAGESAPVRIVWAPVWPDIPLMNHWRQWAASVAGASFELVSQGALNKCWLLEFVLLSISVFSEVIWRSWMRACHRGTEEDNTSAQTASYSAVRRRHHRNNHRPFFSWNLCCSTFTSCIF